MKKLIIIDRDGTIIHEPKEEQQVDSLEKLSFISKVITSLNKIITFSDYELIMVTNQDGLGTPSFPEEDFWPAHNKMLEILQNEGIVFKDVLIDRSFEHENSPGRKPRTGLMKKYLKGNYDLSNSYVIGDRYTDIEFAKNLGAKGIFLGTKRSEDAILNTNNWEDIAQFLILHERHAEITRTTRETDIHIKINLDGSGQADINTGIGFFDHMLEQIARHGDCDLKIKVNGDLHVDEHHTIEDTGLALGEAFNTALGDKKGIRRYGYLLPMDDSLAQVALDFGGRPWLVWEVNFKRDKLGDMPTEMFQHFFKSFSDTAKCNLNIKAEGDNDHHKIESIFKALARSIKVAKERQIENLNRIPSTKGSL